MTSLIQTSVIQTSLIQTPVQEEAVTPIEEPEIIDYPADAAMLSEERVEHAVEWDDLEEILSEEWEIGGAAMTIDLMTIDTMTINTMTIDTMINTMKIDAIRALIAGE
ncbi:MAG TPA: hypothetical protein VGF44_03935 [Terriglobales bacterium]